MDDVRKFRDETTGHNIEDLCVGMSAVYARTVTETDIVLFAGISGDNNPVHMNEVYAQSTVFKSRIVHILPKPPSHSALRNIFFPRHPTLKS